MPPPQTKAARTHFSRVYLLSDSTGNLPRHMMTAFATQFPPNTFTTVSKSFLQAKEQLKSALSDVRKSPGIVLHAFISPELKRETREFCAKEQLPCRDLTGEFVQFLSAYTPAKPVHNPLRLHEMDDHYFQRIKGLDFAIEHDDGLGLDTLYQADIVLTGISRAGKTPTTIHLGQQGVLAANVVLVKGIDPPRELLQIPASKVVGLTIDPDRLAEIRYRRQADLGTTLDAYCDRDEVKDEVRWSQTVIRRHGWHLLDVTNQAIEEVAARALEIVRAAGHASP